MNLVDFYELSTSATVARKSLNHFKVTSLLEFLFNLEQLNISII